jgi:UDPglucose 6-dehydrogenase
VTEWDAFRALDFERLHGIMRKTVLVDLRNIYRPTDMPQHGFDYISVGRRRVARASECRMQAAE